MAAGPGDRLPPVSPVTPSISLLTPLPNQEGLHRFYEPGRYSENHFFFCSELLNFHPRVRATCSPSLATAGHGPESPIFHIQLNQPTTYLFIYKDLSVNHCFPKGTNKNTVANEGNITSRLSRDHETFCSCQHITEKLSEKLKGENFEGSKRKYFYTVISLQHSLPWDVPEAKATKI